VRRANNVYQLLGLARRAGAVVHGTEAVRESIRSGEAKLVLLAGDAARGQLDKVQRTLAGRAVPRASVGDRAGLGAALGVGPITAVAVTSDSLADRVSAELLDDEPGMAGAVEAAAEAAVQAGEG